MADDPRAQGEPAVLHRRRDGAPAARRAAGRQRRATNTTCRSLFLLASTAALFSTSIKEKFLELLPNRIITDSIGSSETGFGGTSIVAKGESHTGGPRVTIDKRTVVLDDDGNEVEPGSGVRGVIAKKGHIPVGYYKDEKKTAETFKTINGVRYAIPGDYAEVEADGTVTMLGRGSVSINSGGEKIYPEEVEAALKGHPDVFDALVVGVPDQRFGQHVAAVVQPREGTRPTLAELDAFVPQRDRGIQSAAQPVVGRRGQALAGGQARLPVGQGHHRGAPGRRRARQTRWGAQDLMRTELCDRFGIDYPIFVFTPSEKVAAAVSKAGGLGVLGCVRFNDPDDLENVLQWMDENTDGKPYGVDIVMPAKVPDRGHRRRHQQADPADASRLRRQDACRPRCAAAARRRGTEAKACSAGCIRWPAHTSRWRSSIRSS